MNQKRYLCWVLALLLIFVSGCGVVDWIFPEENGQQEQPNGGEQQPPDEEDEETGADQVATRRMTLYFADYQGRYTIPVSYPVPVAEGIAKVVVNHLIEGGPAQDYLTDNGLKALLPAGTRVLGMNIKDGVCTVDFSKEFMDTVDVVHERLLLDSLVYSLTEFSTVDSVVIWVEGRTVKSLPHGTKVPEIIGRSGALNPELDGIGIGHSITIYLSLENMAGGRMLVPVTRSVAPAVNLADVALDLLIAGPVSTSSLSEVIPVTTTVDSLNFEGSMAIVDFSADFAQADDLPMAVAAVVMTLTEFSGIDKVKLTVSGQTIQLPDGKSLSEPVFRPSSPNPLAF